MEEKLRLLAKEYLVFRDVVFMESFQIFKPQLIHTLYVVYKWVLRKCLVHFVQKQLKPQDKEMIEKLLSFRQDFSFN